MSPDKPHSSTSSRRAACTAAPVPPPLPPPPGGARCSRPTSHAVASGASSTGRHAGVGRTWKYTS